MPSRPVVAEKGSRPRLFQRDKRGCFIAIRGIQQTSLVDFAGEVCTTIFYGGCNFRCPWCHNADLVLRPFNFPEVNREDVFNLLLRRKSLIQAVCLTGGEPSLEADLNSFIVKLKEYGFKVKLDTNGSQPVVLGRLLAAGLLDYIALDVKAPPEKYDFLTGVKVNLESIKESINLIKSSSTAFEFRTTVVPGFLQELDLLAIGRWLSGARLYVLQQFHPQKTLLDSGLRRLEPYSEEFLQEIASKLKTFFEHVEVKS